VAAIEGLFSKRKTKKVSLVHHSYRFVPGFTSLIPSSAGYVGLVEETSLFSY